MVIGTINGCHSKFLITQFICNFILHVVARGKTVKSNNNETKKKNNRSLNNSSTGHLQYFMKLFHFVICIIKITLFIYQINITFINKALQPNRLNNIYA